MTDRSLSIREGVWFVREMTMSFANIQNISIKETMLARLRELKGAGLGDAHEAGGPAAGSPGNTRVLAALGEVRGEARRLRQAVS